MVAAPPRVPPRFVPTLTEVVPEPVGAESPVPPVAALPAATDTRVMPATAPVHAADPQAGSVLPDGFEEYVVHRVMQRVDLMLEQRLRQVIARVTEEQTRSLVPRLREEVEAVVRDSVYDAVAQELAAERQNH